VVTNAEDWMPASHLQTLHAMAYNNAWANHRLLAACAGLTQAEFEAPRTGFFPSIQATLNHILIIDRFYVDALEGGTLGRRRGRIQFPVPPSRSCGRPRRRSIVG
jgi:uncharacterized damage-inducible protein DinB